MNNEFDDFFGFDEESVEEAKNDVGFKNLGAGVYTVMIEKVAFMCRGKGKDAYSVERPADAGMNLSIEVGCLLTEEQNGFAEGWKHTIFIKPTAENEIARKIGKKQMAELCAACGVPTDPNFHNAVVGKIIEIELIPQKNNPEYTNVKEIRSAGNVQKKTTQKPVSSGEPDWKKKNTATETPTKTPAAPKGKTPAGWDD